MLIASVQYAAAKHGVLGLSRTDAAAYGRDGIRVNSVCPGLIATPCTIDSSSYGGVSSALTSRVVMLETLRNGSNYDTMLEGTPINRLGKPEEVAQTCVFLASTRASYITGEEILVDGGLLHNM